jgi:acylphosphatase
MVGRRLLISGRVQGVFYRGWAEQNARALGINGWVRNLRGGEVELLASGSEQAVDELIRRCRQGPPAAEVSTIEVSDSDEDAPAGFAQKPTV